MRECTKQCQAKAEIRSDRSKGIDQNEKTFNQYKVQIIRRLFSVRYLSMSKQADDRLQCVKCRFESRMTSISEKQ